MLAIRLLGAEEAGQTDGRVVEALLRQPKRFALLAYLAAAEPQGFQRRDALIGLLWPDSDQTHARHALSQAVYFLRRVLGKGAVVTRGGGEVALDTDVAWCDVWAFRRAMEEGNFEEAVSLYRGPFLEGCAFGTSAAFEHWVDCQRDRLVRSYARALEQLAEACASRGDRQGEIAWWRRLAEHDPYSTHVTVRLMAALEAAGDRAGALHEASRQAAKLREDLQAVPSADTVAYARELRIRPKPHHEVTTDPLGGVAHALGQRYTIVRELSGGAMATVYLARDSRHGRPVVVKVLRAKWADAIGAEMFLREIKLTSALAHPLILPLLDSGGADGLLYYVMPYVEGGSLRERLRRDGPLPLDDSLAIAREVADALGFAHDHGVVHRDVKPANILLEAGHAVIADFGVGGVVTVARATQCLNMVVAVGTPAYLSPEQAAGSTNLDGRSDLYSLGCVLHEMLTGMPPFTGPTVESVIQQHLCAELPRVTAVRPSVPGWVAAALSRSLAKLPAERFPRMASFAEAITPPSGGVAESDDG